MNTTEKTTGAGNETSPQSVTPKQRIADAALSLFLRHGYEGTSIVQIVEASKVSKGAFYHYFSSKAQIHKEVAESYFLTPFAKLNLKTLAKLPPKKATALLRRFFSDHPSNGFETPGQNILCSRSFMFDSFIQLPGFDKKIAKKYNKIIKALARSIAKSKFPDRKPKSVGKDAKRQAKTILATIEGELLLDAILGQNQQK